MTFTIDLLGVESVPNLTILFRQGQLDVILEICAYNKFFLSHT